jgi:hypothetical protein
MRLQEAIGVVELLEQRVPERAHAAAVHGMRLEALDLLRVAVDDADLDAAAGRALAADARAPSGLAG